MPILVPGRSSRLFRVNDGFTLIEVLLVLLIAGILAGTVFQSLSFRHASAQDEAERLARRIEHAQMMAPSLGGPIGIAISGDRYEFLRWSGTWKPIDLDYLSGRTTLPEGITMELLADDSGPVPHILRFPPTGYPPPFGIRVTGLGNVWLITGNRAGRVVVENQDSSS